MSEVEQITERGEVRFQPSEVPAIPVEKGDAVTNIEGVDIPSKFIQKDGSVDIKNLVKSYTNLEKMKSGNNTSTNTNAPETKAETTPDNTEPVVDNTPDVDPESLFDAKDMERWGQEFASTGKLSEQAYKEICKYGVSREMIDTYIHGVKSSTQLDLQKSFSKVGGESEYKKMIGWAINNLTQQEKEIFNKGIATSTDRDYHIKNLYKRYKAGNPTYVQGNNVAESQYADKTEFFADIKRKEYETDPAFRARVLEKVKRSNINL